MSQLASAKQSTPGVATKQKDPNYYRRFILEDLAPWKDHGITKVLLADLSVIRCPYEVSYALSHRRQSAGSTTRLCETCRLAAFCLQPSIWLLCTASCKCAVWTSSVLSNYADPAPHRVV